MKKVLSSCMALLLLSAAFSGCANRSETEISSLTETFLPVQTDTSPSQTAFTGNKNANTVPTAPSELEFYPCNSSYNPYYIQKTANVMRAQSNGTCVLSIPHLNQYHTVPGCFGQDFACTAMVENTVLVFVPGDVNVCGRWNQVRMLKLDLDTGQTEQSIIPLPSEYTASFLFCSMINDQDGYLFIFSDGMIGELAFLLKTQDGGNSWVSVESESFPQFYGRDIPVFAQAIDENTAIISCRYAGSEFLSDRTFLTFDGGRTWEKMADLAYPTSGSDFATDLSDFEISDSQFIMTVRIYTGREPYQYLQFSSSDLKSWSLKE